jgi:cytochrome c-type biogenesis protein CcmF
MIVHIGVVVLAVGLAAASAFGHRTEVQLTPGQTATFEGHTVEFVGTRTVRTASVSQLQAVLRVDGAGTYTPAISSFGTGSQDVGTPAIDSSWRDDVYLTIDSTPTTGDRWTFGVVVQPLVDWLWIGGALVAVGSVLSAVPGRRRRPTDPVSTPVADTRLPGPGGGGDRPVPAAVGADDDR